METFQYAFLFTGADGVGKENAALCFTKELNHSKENQDKSKSVFSLIDNLSEPYIKYILPLPRGKSETEQNDPYEKLTEDEIDQINLEFKKKSKIIIIKFRFLGLTL